jgi:hypothetical protein
MRGRPLATLAAAGLLAATWAALPAARAGGGEVVAWDARVAIAQPFDVAGPRPDGRLVVAAGNLLSLLDPADDSLTPYARGPGGYEFTGSGEPYIAMAPPGTRRRAGCSYGREAVYAIDPTFAAGATAGVIRIGGDGRARRFADFETGFPSGIVFDRIGRFGGRLLVLVQDAPNAPSTLYSVGCRGRVETVVEDGPQVEGGLAIAPRSFGRFGGTLIAPDEFSGRIYAFRPGGGVRTVVADSSIPTGQDIGVESAGFVPRLRAGVGAWMADVGRDVILFLGRDELQRAGLERGDLLVGSEGPETGTIAVRCARQCRSHQVAVGPLPNAGHGEGHLLFARR